MKFNYSLISFFFLFSLLNEVNPFFISRDEDLNNRLLTENSITNVVKDLYMVNYTNDYYLEDMLQKGSKDYAELYNYALSRYGNLYDFNFFPQSSSACSVFNVLNSEKQYLFARNFDNPDSPSFMIWTHPKNGYKSISFVLGLYLGMSNSQQIIKDRLLLLPYAPLDGMNEKGLGIAILNTEVVINTHQKNPNKIDLSSTIMIRGVLDNCETTEEAIQFFDKYNMHDINPDVSYHFFVTDSNGTSAVIEYVDDEMIVIRNN
jgi:predicted choloylglycine hydrolase